FGAVFGFVQQAVAVRIGARELCVAVGVEFGLLHLAVLVGVVQGQEAFRGVAGRRQGVAAARAPRRVAANVQRGQGLLAGVEDLAAAGVELGARDLAVMVRVQRGETGAGLRQLRLALPAQRLAPALGELAHVFLDLHGAAAVGVGGVEAMAAERFEFGPVQPAVAAVVVFGDEGGDVVAVAADQRTRLRRGLGEGGKGNRAGNGAGEQSGMRVHGMSPSGGAAYWPSTRKVRVVLLLYSGAAAPAGALVR